MVVEFRTGAPPDDTFDALQDLSTGPALPGLQPDHIEAPNCELPLEQVGVDVAQAVCEVTPLEVHATVETELLPRCIDPILGKTEV